MQKFLGIVILFSFVLLCYFGHHLKVNRDLGVQNNLAPLSDIKRPISDIIFAGYSDLYEDYVYLWLLQNLLAQKDRSLAKLYPQILSATKIKADIRNIYTLSCFVLAFDFNQAHLCEGIIADGMKTIDNSWQLPMLMGFIYAFKLKDNIKAAYYYDLASQQKKSPKYFSSFAKKLLKKEHTREDFIRAVDEIDRLHPGSSIRKFINTYRGVIK
jgi:hypothetical protein